MLNINLATSATTRKPRVGEVDGKDYYFLTIPEFEKRLANGEFLEYAKVHENYYGTLKSEVESRLANGENVTRNRCTRWIASKRKISRC